MAGRVPVEVSGGVTLATVRAYAEAGADFIAVGALTHSAPAADISLEIEPRLSAPLGPTCLVATSGPPEATAKPGRRPSSTTATSRLHERRLKELARARERREWSAW